MDSDPQSRGGSSASSSGGGKPVLAPLETRLMIAALASGKLQPTPEVLEKLRLYEEEGLRRDHEKLVWMRARDEASARSEAAGGRGLRERTMAYDYECDREAFQDYARISRQRARHEASASAVAAGGWGVHERTMPYGREAFQDYAKISRLQGQKDAIPGAAAGRSGLGETGGLDHEATDKLVNQAKIQVDSVGLAKPVLGLGTELPDQLRFRMKQLPSVHTGGQLTPKVPEKMMHCEKGAHQDYAKVDQLQQAWQEAGAGTTAGGGCQHERMVLYEQEFLQDFAEFTRLQKASFGAAPGGGLDGVGGRLNHEVMDKLVRRAMERMQGMVEIMTPQVISKDFVYEPLMQFIGQYPKWLGANRDKLSKEEYEQYEKQLDLMVNLTVVYENEPQNFSKIVNIMQKIQECGMPPSDIVADIFPGIDLSTVGQQFRGMLEIPGCCIL